MADYILQQTLPAEPIITVAPASTGMDGFYPLKVQIVQIL